MISKSLKVLKQWTMDRGNSEKSEGFQKRVVSKLDIFWRIDINKYIVRIYITVPWQLWNRYVLKHVLQKSCSKAVAILIISLKKLNYLYSFLSLWEEAARRSYTCYTSLRVFVVRNTYTYWIFKRHVSCATRIFLKNWSPNHVHPVQFRCITRNIAMCSFPTMEKLLEATQKPIQQCEPPDN